ncbi:MAG: YtxH domain-containing protein [Bacteroidota bacterium]
MSQRSRAARASLWGFFVGGAAGIAVGLLLAPDEGRQLRRRAAYLLDRWAGDLSALLDRLDNASVPSDARAQADALVADARQQAESLLLEADDLIHQARTSRGAA